MRPILLSAILLAFGVTHLEADPIRVARSDFIQRAVGYCGDPCVVSRNNGGRIIDFEDAATAIRSGAKKHLVIDGYCASACVVLADRARPRTCITSQAVFAYHKTNRNRALPLSGDIHGWIIGNGGYPEFEGRPGIMSNSVARRFWPVCSPAIFAAKDSIFWS